MHAQFKINKVASQLIKSPENSPSIILNGKSKFTKSLTFKIFNEIVEEFGQIIDFNSSLKRGLKFSIKTVPQKYKAMMKQLKKNNFLIFENVIDKRKSVTPSAIFLYLIIIVDVT